MVMSILLDAEGARGLLQCALAQGYEVGGDSPVLPGRTRLLRFGSECVWCAQLLLQRAVGHRTKTKVTTLECQQMAFGKWITERNPHVKVTECTAISPFAATLDIISL